MCPSSCRLVSNAASIRSTSRRLSRCSTITVRVARFGGTKASSRSVGTSGMPLTRRTRRARAMRQRAFGGAVGVAIEFRSPDARVHGRQLANRPVATTASGREDGRELLLATLRSTDLLGLLDSGTVLGDCTLAGLEAHLVG